MPNYPCSQYERVFSRHASLRNYVKSHDSIVDRVLREIADEIEEEVNVHEQPMEIDVSDDEREDANDNEREDASDNEHQEEEEQLELSDEEVKEVEDIEEVRK